MKQLPTGQEGAAPGAKQAGTLIDLQKSCYHVVRYDMDFFFRPCVRRKLCVHN